MVFDPGYGLEPFATLCANVPDERSYRPDQYRTEWGPIFHRGRLDGTARLLGIGQDPAAHEAVARRILCGEAGHRVQGFLHRLGLTHSYVLINAYVYSIYGTGTPKPTKRMLEDRFQWIDALLATAPIEGVVTFGRAARRLWESYLEVRQPASPPPMAAAVHPTARIPDSELLQSWNAALSTLDAAIVTRDRPSTTLRLYTGTVADMERRPIPAADFPPGLPAWMRTADAWARRGDGDPAPKASRITITIPVSAREDR